MKIPAVIAVIWLGLGALNFAGANADFRGEFDFIRHSEIQARKNCGVSGLFAMMGPFGFPVVLFTSGFYVHGLSFNCGVER